MYHDKKKNSEYDTKQNIRDKGWLLMMQTYTYIYDVQINIEH